ncbi:MAG: TusE/DsrC/DsvC family sulfur relay protein [Pseudomonadales bacterium]
MLLQFSEKSIALDSIALDNEGFLKNLADWDKPVATALASNEGLSLDETHWEVIHLVRNFYQEFELSPSMRPMVKYIAQHLGKEKGNSLYLLHLFPGSPAKIVSKLAGLPKPDNCL